MLMPRSLKGSIALATLLALSIAEGRAHQVTESPFRCDMSMLSAAIRARKDTIGGILASRRLHVTPLPDGYEFQFPGDGETFSLVSEWLVTERLCCPFFDFEVRLGREGGPLALRLTGRPGTKAFMESEFVRWLKTDTAEACSASAPKANLNFVLRDLDGHGKARPFARDLGVNCPILDGTDRADVEQAFGVRDSLPTSLIIARDGRVCWKHIGLPPLPPGMTDIKAATRDVFAAEIGQLIGRAS